MGIFFYAVDLCLACWFRDRRIGSGHRSFYALSSWAGLGGYFCFSFVGYRDFRNENRL